MQLILLERVEGLGNVGDEVSVRPGYGRNFLLPQNKAITANDANRKMFERRRKILEEKQQAVLEEAKAKAGQLADLGAHRSVPGALPHSWRSSCPAGSR